MLSSTGIQQPETNQRPAAVVLSITPAQKELIAADICPKCTASGCITGDRDAINCRICGWSLPKPQPVYVVKARPQRPAEIEPPKEEKTRKPCKNCKKEFLARKRECFCRICKNPRMSKLLKKP